MLPLFNLWIGANLSRSCVMQVTTLLERFWVKERKAEFMPFTTLVKLNDAQLNYATTEKEFLVVVFAFEKFRSYIVNSKVIVYTDHVAIKYLLAKKDAKP
jgi:hypothetical protein